MKDPAFLFYSKDFYEGTRMLMPEERACYVDLMIYQHQNGIIPDDIKRLKMYCSGVDETTLIATLQAKFERCSEGWKNRKLENVILERQEYIGKQSMNGKIGQFWVKAKKNLELNDYKKLRKYTENKDINELHNIISEYITDETTLSASLATMLKHLAIENESNIPSFDLKKKEAEKFYKNQLELSNNDPNYKKYIDVLFGENKAGIELTGVLSLPEQMTYKHFVDLLAQCKAKGKSLIQFTLDLENNKKYYLGRKSLYLILNKWLSKDE